MAQTITPDNGMIRVAEDSPVRCQANMMGGRSQCIFQRIPNSEYCPMHTANGQRKADDRALKLYRLQNYRERVEDIAGSPYIKSLKEEIGILRMALEQIINMCDTPNKLSMYLDKMTNMIAQIAKLVNSAQNLEEKAGTLIDKSAIMVFADTIVSILSQYITDPDILIEIGTKIDASLTELAGPKDRTRSFSEVGNGTLALGN
jgi:hypothetical protein